MIVYQAAAFSKTAVSSSCSCLFFKTCGFVAYESTDQLLQQVFHMPLFGLRIYVQLTVSEIYHYTVLKQINSLFSILFCTHDVIILALNCLDTYHHY